MVTPHALESVVVIVMQSVSPARNCPGVAVVVWWRWMVTMTYTVPIRTAHRTRDISGPGTGQGRTRSTRPVR